MPARLPACLPAGWVGATAKQEGLVALGDCVVAIGDDNDFGVGGTPQSQLNIVRLPKCLTELYQASWRSCSMGLSIETQLPHHQVHDPVRWFHVPFCRHSRALHQLACALSMPTTSMPGGGSAELHASWAEAARTANLSYRACNAAARRFRCAQTV